MLCEVQSLDFGVELRIYMVAVQAEAHDPAHFGFGTPTFAILALPPIMEERRIGLGKHCLGNALYRFGLMPWTRTKLNGAIYMVKCLHWETANALAIVFAPAIVACEIAIMSMAHVSPASSSGNDHLKLPCIFDRPNSAASSFASRTPTSRIRWRSLVGMPANDLSNLRLVCSHARDSGPNRQSLSCTEESRFPIR